MLLNPRDRFDVIAIADGIAEKPTLQARIAGVEEVAFLTPLRDGIGIEAMVTSLLYELREDWPSPGQLTAQVGVLPVVIDPTGTLNDEFHIAIDGKQVRSPALVDIHVTKSAHAKNLQVVKIDKPLKLRFRSAEILDLTATLGRETLSEKTLSRYIRWGNDWISVLPIPLSYDRELSILVVASGACSDIAVESMPSLMTDIQMMDVKPGEFVESNLGKAEPVVLLSNQRVHRIWLRYYPEVRKKLGQFKVKTQEFLTRSQSSS
jgi:hypothetical protein